MQEEDQEEAGEDEEVKTVKMEPNKSIRIHPDVSDMSIDFKKDCSSIQQRPMVNFYDEAASEDISMLNAINAGDNDIEKSMIKINDQSVVSK